MRIKNLLRVGKQFGYERDELKTSYHAERVKLRADRLYEREFAREAAEKTRTQQENAKS